MKNIKTLILSNFQQWKSGEIKFTSGLNILIGNTESGKSTLFRAINSILTGKMPEDYIRKGSKGCEVKIEFTDNTTFRRLRNKKDNIADANGLIFERVGKDIPFEYFKQLGKTSIEFGNKELSLCSYSQFEPHFFITLSDYDKSKLIGTICGIDIVDKLVDSINKDIRSNNSTIKFLEEEISKQKEELDKNIPVFESLQKKTLLLAGYWNDIDSKFKTLENLSKSRYNLGLLNNDISTSKTELDGLKRKIKHFNTDKIKRLHKLFEVKTSLDSILHSITTQTILKNLLKTTNPVNVEKANLLDDLMFLKQKLESYNKQIEEKAFYKKQVDESLIILAKQKKELLKDYDKCPLCGGIL